MKPLTERQRAVLVALEVHKVWHPGCPWVYGNPSTTASILAALEAKGLVESIPYGKGRLYAMKGQMPS